MCWDLVFERQQSFSFQTFLGSHAGARWGWRGGGREGAGVGRGGRNNVCEHYAPQTR